MKLVCSIFLLFLFSCSSPYTQNYCILGPDEFIADSMLIKEGKTGIQELEGMEIPCLPIDAMNEYPDVIAEGDVLNIALYHPSRIDLMESFKGINQSIGGFPVIDGGLLLPCIDPIPVIGLTLAEARQKIRACFREQIDDVDVFISYKSRLSHKVELAGLVQRSDITIDGKMRLYEVLAIAHIPSEANLAKSYISRNGERLNVDFYRLLHEGDMSQNIILKGGDKIFIGSPHDSCILVMGEVRAPRPIPVPYGFMSLREALALAYGIPYSGNADNILVIRGNIACPKIYVVSLKFTIHQRNDQLLLIPGDVVYVSQKAITQWNIFIQEVTPTINAFLGSYELYKIAK